MIYFFTPKYCLNLINIFILIFQDVYISQFVNVYIYIYTHTHIYSYMYIHICFFLFASFSFTYCCINIVCIVCIYIYTHTNIYIYISIYIIFLDKKCILISLSCYNRIPESVWFKGTNIYFSWFWRPEILQSKCSRSSAWGGHFPWFADNLFLKLQG